MRQARLTWPGAFHHVMNRGLNGEFIFQSNKLKNGFLTLLKEKSSKLKIRIFAFCIMDNHFHLVLENTTGQMSEFMKTLNGSYGLLYRQIMGGIGYVFQSRYRSTLIESDSYLLQSISYALLNPVRAELKINARDYRWSSIGEYFTGKASENVDNEFVEELIGSKREFNILLNRLRAKDLPIQHTEFGGILGDEGFFAKAKEKFERRKKQQFVNRKRRDDLHFVPVDQVIWEFEKKHKIEMKAINPQTLKGKRQRAELLVNLRDHANMKYSDISMLEPFSDVKFSSLRSIYKRKKASLKL